MTGCWCDKCGVASVLHFCNSRGGSTLNHIKEKEALEPFNSTALSKVPERALAILFHNFALKKKEREPSLQSVEALGHSKSGSLWSM